MSERDPLHGETWLDDWLDGELDDHAEAEAARRLAEDASLRRELAARRRLRRRAGHLPREITPPTDLWPGIQSRLASVAPAGRPRQSRTEKPPAVSRARGRRWRTELWAAALGLALGAALTYAALGGGAAAPVSDSEVAARPALASGPTLVDLSTQLETDFLRARETLFVEVMARRDQLPPETWTVVVENLAILDRAIRDLRHALGEDPGNRRLERMLLSNHQRQLDLLHRLSREV